MSITKRELEKLNREDLYFFNLELTKEEYERFLIKNQQDEDEQLYREIIESWDNPSNVRAVDLYQQC